MITEEHTPNNLNRPERCTMCHKLFLIFLLVVFSGCSMAANDHSFAQTKNTSLNSIFRQVNPAVVEIGVILDQARQDNSDSEGVLGSGVVVSKDGLVLTSSHVVDSADTIVVRFLDDTTSKASIVSSAAQADVALLQLDNVPPDLSPAMLGDSDAAEVGDQILIIGAPYGIRHTMTVGYISGRRQSQSPCPSMTPFEFLQTDAAINQGNSGGPMLNMQGRVIGIVSRILSRSGGSEGLGFAVGINSARNLVLNEESIWIGFDATLISGKLAQALNVPQEAGLLVQKVATDSLAEEMGLVAGRIQTEIGGRKWLLGGDIILDIQGTRIRPSIKSFCALNDIVGGFTSSSHIEMTVLRNGQKLRLSTQP